VAGRPVQGEGGPITVPAGARVEIDANGTVTGTVGNGLPQVLGRLKLVTPEGRLARGEDGLFRAEAGDLPADPTARLVPAALEGSNVSAVETMVQMIAAARQFEHQMRLVKTMEQKEQAATRLLGPA
jgi:flagellar basal-body rod protein FlgF